MDRRRLLAGSCAAFAAAALPVPAQCDTAFLPLKTPVHIPLDAVGQFWVSVPFKARFTKSDGLDSVVPGLALRTPAGVTAICTYCPHELCVIKLDQRQLRCPCHFSLFDPQHDGAWISGPAQRRTFQFQYDARDPDLVVTGVEAGLERRLL
jgi:arsenite oxidase small subunit